MDAGDGASQQLGYKIRKIDTVVCTHAHRDHIGGLLQVVNQRGEAGSFALGYPCGSSSFRALEEFAAKFNPGTARAAVWQPLEEGDELPGSVEGRLIKAFRTRHYANENSGKPPRSLGFHLLWRKQKVRPEYRDLAQSELDALREKVGREGITSPETEKWITIGGDGSPLSPQEVAGSQLLLHEATFLSAEDYDEEAGEDYGHVHSTVAQALEVAHEAKVPEIVLYHVSTRYTDAQIHEAVKSEAARLGLKAKVWVALPRRVHWNLLGEKPVFNHE